LNRATQVLQQHGACIVGCLGNHPFGALQNQHAESDEGNDYDDDNDDA
jgi:hypothetical protein